MQNNAFTFFKTHFYSFLRSAVAFRLNSEVHGSSVPPPPFMPLQLYTDGLSGGEPGTPP